MPDVLILALIGFSIGAAALLLIAQMTIYRGVEQTWLSRGAGVVLLLGLVALQVAHAAHLRHGVTLFEARWYVALLYLVAPAFFLFFRGALQVPGPEHAGRLLHFLPVLIGPWLDPRFAVPLAFLIGTGYALRLAQLVLRMRAQRKRFRLELAVFAAFAAVALAILGFGLVAPWYAPQAFFVAYATLIGLAFWLALLLLLRFPDLVAQAAEAMRAAYAVSTLARIDRDAALARLHTRMAQDRLYTDEALNLARVAEAVELTPHQLSELVNTHFGVGFSRYLRERRVEAARRMLVDEPNASVLSIGLAVGFTSQSNFYAAFRDITGEVPGRFRKSALRDEA